MAKLAEAIKINAASKVETVDLWKSAVEAIQKRCGGSLDLWFEQIQDVKVEGGKIVICVPNRFTREWIKEKYGAQILKEFKKLTAREFEIHFTFGSKRGSIPNGGSESGRAGKRRHKQSNPFGASSVNEKYTFSHFVEGPANQLAAEACKMVAFEPNHAISPLYIHGATGLGKTHLMCSIYHARKQGGGNGIIYISAESFLNQFIEKINSKSMNEFRDTYRKNCSTLLIDDIQYIASKQKTQEEFFHCFNELHNAGKTIVLASNRPPGQLDRVDDVLRSRFGWGLVVDIQPLCFETRLAIVRGKAKLMGFDITEGVAVMVAEYAKNNVREIEGVLIRLQMQSKIRKEAVTVELVKEVMTNFTGAAPIKVAVDDVIRHVSAAYGLKISDVRGDKRNRTVVLPRQVAMYICREFLKMSYPEIGGRFGGKNHTTVISACRKIEALARKDLAVLSTIERLTGQMGLSGPDRFVH